MLLPAPRADAADLFFDPDPQAFLPAVSMPNAKLDGFAGTKFDRSFEGATGAVSLPLGPRFGLQIDAMIGSWDGSTFAGTAGHLFWRDPNVALIGIYGSFSNLDRLGGISIGKIAFEGELYLGRFSIETLIGHEGGDIPSRLYAVVDVAHYFTDDFRASIGYRRTTGADVLALGGEWRLPLQSSLGVSIFAEGRIGSNDYRGVWGGLRFYFGGQDKSLIRRHREDDPRVRLTDDVPLLIQAAPPPPPPPPPPPRQPID